MAGAGVEEPQVLKSKEFFPAVFSRHAEAYLHRLDDIMARGESRGRLRVIELAEVRPGMRIIDLACGPGSLSRRLAQLAAPGGEVVGVDLAPGMIALARAQHIKNTRFEVMDIERLTFEAGTFDAATCGHGLQFVPDLSLALREARRVLKAGGRLAASVPAAPVKDSVWKLLDTTIDHWLPPSPEIADQRPTRAVVADPSAFRAAAQGAGFTAVEVEVIEETVHWRSAEHLVSMFMGWWDCAARLESVGSERREAMKAEAIDELKRRYPGEIETVGRNLVLMAHA